MSLEKLSALAMDQHKAEQAVVGAEADLKILKAVLAVVSEKLIPELMDELGIETFTTTEGLIISVVENIRASISKGNAPGAFTWLRKNGHSSLIKNKVAIDLGKRDPKVLLKMTAAYEPSITSTVNAQTLSAWCREKLKAGDDIPMDLLGVYRQRVSKVQVKK